MSTWRPAEDGFFNPYDSGPARPPISTAESAGGPQASPGSAGYTPPPAGRPSAAYGSSQAQTARNRVIAAYKSFLGREPSEEEINSQLSGGRYVAEKNIATAEQNIRSSPEAATYATLGAGGVEKTGDVPPPTPTPTPTANTNGPRANRYGAEGFDGQREQKVEYSAKDSFLAALDNAPEPPPGEDKAALKVWFEKYISPAMTANGHKINWVDGDKMNFTSPQGTFTVDWYRGAGAKGGAPAWQVEGAAGESGGGGTTAQAAGGTSNGDASQNSSAVMAQQNLTGGGTRDTTRRIMAQLEARYGGREIAKGGAPLY